MSHWYGYGMGGWGYTLMTVGTLLFWALVIAGIVLLVRYFTHRPHNAGQPPEPPAPPGASRPAPEDLLAERFARGEINEDEYRRGLDLLRQRRPSAPGP